MFIRKPKNFILRYLRAFLGRMILASAAMMRQSYSQPLAFSYVSGIRTIIIWYAVVSVETCVLSACFHRVHQSSLILSETSSSAFYMPILSLVKSLFYSFAPGGFGSPLDILSGRSHSCKAILTRLLF